MQDVVENETETNMWQPLISSVEDRFHLISSGGGKFFTVKTRDAPLWDEFRNFLLYYGGEELQQHYNCSKCRDFIEKFGNVVYITDDFRIAPVMWFNTYRHDPLSRTFTAMEEFIQTLKVDSEWYTDLPEIGVRKNLASDGREWTHFYICTKGTPFFVPPSSVETAHQKMAASRERFTGLTRDTGINLVGMATLQDAEKLLSNNTLARSDQFLPIVRFHIQLKQIDSSHTGAYFWKHLSKAPRGWENVNSSAIGQLYRWIASNIKFDELVDRWGQMVSGVNYQRPKAGPSQAEIDRAETIVEKLGCRKSFERRYAQLEDLHLLWKPQEEAPTDQPPGGLFGNLLTKDTNLQQYQDHIQPKLITLEKFRREIMPDAMAMEFRVPEGGSFIGFTTAVHADAPPILRWDTEENRYPVCFYTYEKGTRAEQWSLRQNEFVKVTGITDLPNYPKPIAFILEGCMDTNVACGMGLFPETMRSEFHEVRSVIESYSSKGTLAGRDTGSACGYAVGDASFGAIVRVKNESGWRTFNIDRED